MKLLILTNKDDAHADAIIDACDTQINGLVPIRVNTEDLFSNISFVITEFGFDLSIKDSGRTCSLRELSSAWYRRPISPTVSTRFDDSLDQFMIDEGWEIIKGIFGQCRGLNCLPTAAYSVPPRNKISQLFIAKNLGFNVPATCISNVYDDLIDFAKSYEACLAKTLRWPSLKINNIIYPMYASKVTQESIIQSRDNGTPCGPVFLQKAVSKVSDVRLTFVGDRHFAVSMISNDHRFFDIREVEPNYIDYSSIDAPGDVIELSKEFLKISNLQYSALDFVIDDKGTWWFLENNPNGQFFWLQRETGLPIKESILEFFGLDNQRITPTA